MKKQLINYETLTRITSAISATREPDEIVLMTVESVKTALLEGVEILDEHLGATHECMRIPDSNRLFNDPISMELMINATVEWIADHIRNPVHSTSTPTTETFAPPAETEPIVNPQEDAAS